MELWDLNVRDMVTGMPALSPSYNSERGESIVQVVSAYGACLMGNTAAYVSHSIFFIILGGLVNVYDCLSGILLACV